jgi:hypothetical protein
MNDMIFCAGGAAMGPIPAEARRQEGLKLERPGASPPQARRSYGLSVSAASSSLGATMVATLRVV